MKKKSSLSRLFEYAGNYKYLTVLSWILSAVSAWIALVPFYYIWRIIKEVLAVAPDYSQAQNLKGYGWAAVGFALLSMIIYVGSLMCSHVAAFHVQAEMRSQMMHHIVTLPMGFMDSEGSGKIRKIVNESSAATETYLAHHFFHIFNYAIHALHHIFYRNISSKAAITSLRVASSISE